MKKQHAIFILTIFVLMITIRANGQTYQTGWTYEIYDEPVLCLGENVYGIMTYHAVVHVDPKTGYLKSIHWNCIDGFFTGAETGISYILIDTGKDQLGWFWYDFSSMGIIPEEIIPLQFPEEGILLNKTFMWIAKGKGPVIHGGMSAIIKMNAHGDITVERMDLDFCE
jgi:hypothetical protein